MEHTYDIITVGDAKLDVFLVLPEVANVCSVDHEHSTLCLPFGTKIDVDNSQFLMGGNAANVSVGLARLGIKTALCAEIGDDEFSLKIINSLAREEIDRGLVTYTQHSISSFSVILEVGGDRTIFSQHIHRPHNFKLDNFTAQYVYITSLGEEWKMPYDYVLKWAKEHQVKIAFNPGSLQLGAGREAIQDILQNTEILFLNKEEALHLTGAEVRAERLEDNKELLVATQKLGPKIVVITDGVKGSFAMDEKGQMYSQTVFPANLVGRTGAGDAFSSGCLAAIFWQQPLPTALQWGAANSAAVVEHIGAETGLLKKEELEARVNNSRINE